MIHARELREKASIKLDNILTELETELIARAEDGWLETTYEFPKLHEYERDMIIEELSTANIDIEFVDNTHAIISWAKK